MSLTLQKSLQDKLVNAPEVTYGVSRIVVILKDGRRFDDVLVAWGREIIKVNGSTLIPFVSSEIHSIERSDLRRFTIP